MGVGFVLIIWAVLGCFGAAVGAVVLGWAAKFLTRGATQGRNAFLTAAFLFSFICLVWGGAVFVFQAIINEGFLNRDLGVGDTWHAPLTNGYQVMFIDLTDHGIVYNPTTQPSDSGVVNKEDAVDQVQQLQVANQYILGARSSCVSCVDAGPIDNWFILDTQTNKRESFDSLDGLKTAAARVGVPINLEPIYSVYSRYRFTWFDVFVGVLFVAPPIAGFMVLLVWLRRVRRTRTFVSA